MNVPTMDSATSVSRPLRVALLGCGAAGEIMARRLYSRRPDLVTVTWTVDEDLERASRVGQMLGAKPVVSLEDVLGGGDVDAIDVRVPHHLHHAAAMPALEAGIPVLLEKPMATELTDGLQLMEKAARTGAVLAVGENYGFLAAVRAARDLLRSGAIGPLLLARANRTFRLSGVWARPWRLDGEPMVGGVVLDQCCHQTRMLREVVGEITHVASMLTQAPGASEHVAAVLCRFAGGEIGTQTYTWASETPRPGPELTLVGEEGSIEVHVSYDEPGGGAVLYRPDGPVDGVWTACGEDYYASLDAVVIDFLTAVAQGCAPAATADSGLRDLAVTMAVYEAAASGRTVSVDDLVAVPTSPGEGPQ